MAFEDPSSTAIRSSILYPILRIVDKEPARDCAEDRRGITGDGPEFTGYRSFGAEGTPGIGKGDRRVAFPRGNNNVISCPSRRRKSRG